MNLEKIDHVLKNKLVLCTGPSLHRKELLNLTYQNDIRFFSFKKIFLSTNDPENINALPIKASPITELIPNQNHGLNCINCLITSIKNAVNDPELLDDDIILFKHESYFARDLNLIRKALGTIVLKHNDMVIQTFLTREGIATHHYGAFFIKVVSARPVFKNLSIVTSLQDSVNSEHYATHRIFYKIKSIYSVYSKTTTADGDGKLGFYHIPWHGLHPEALWQKEDYDDLFKDVILTEDS